MKKILITGGNRGIGKAVAAKLAAQGHHIVIVARSITNGRKAIRQIKEKQSKAMISLVTGDLSTIKNCYKLVEKIKGEHSDISVLINNAGVWMTEKQLNKDGLEISFMVNYLAPCILSLELRETLQRNVPSRIVNVNAGLYLKGAFHPEKTPYGLDFSPFKTYANSKLCGAMFTIDLSKQLAGTGISINAVHPGVIRTGLGDSSKIISKLVGLIKIFWKPPAYGAEAPARLATDKEVEGVNGKYFNRKKITEYSAYAKDDKLRRALWNKTIEILKKPSI